MQTLERIWEYGIPLFEADFHFAASHLRDEYRALGKVIKPLPDLSDDHWSREVWDTISRRIMALAARNDLRAKMMDELLASLSAKMLVPYGLSAIRYPEAPPIQVPCELFENRVLDPTQGGLAGNGLIFVSVRIVGPDILRHAEIGTAMPPPISSTH